MTTTTLPYHGIHAEAGASGAGPGGRAAAPARHVLSLADLELDEILYMVERGLRIKAGQLDPEALRGRTVGIYFQATSTRTRTSFTVGAARLGATVVTYGPGDLQTNTGETVEDTVRVLAGFLDALVVRAPADTNDMRDLALGGGGMSVVNAMSAREHPTQAIADLVTIREQFGGLEGIRVLYMGEGNNTAVALALGMARIPGMQLTLATPDGYGLPAGVMEQVEEFTRASGAVVEEHHRADQLPQGVDVVYTTRWQTTGTSKPDPDWRTRFAPFAVTEAVMEQVSRPSGTVFMHDLPAVRDEEVEATVLDGAQSIAIRQAHNKLFGAMAVLEWCLAGRI